MSPPTLTTLDTALAFAKAGLSAIPIRTDGSKAPACDSWTEFQTRIASEPEIREMFHRFCGLAIVAGDASGLLEIIDCESEAPFGEFCALVTEHDPSLIGILPHVETPSGGHHLFHRSDEISGNQKLAMKLVHGKPDVLFETRGRGGYVLTVSSPPECHKAHKEYRLIRGKLPQIPRITPEQRSLLFDCARSFNQIRKEKVSVPAHHANGNGNAPRPGDVFAERVNWPEILEPHGWICAGSRGDESFWRRPGKTFGFSATLNYRGTDSFYVFSTNAHPFEHETSYTKFYAYTLLEHAGDTRAAARALAVRFGMNDQQESAAERRAIQEEGSGSVPEPESEAEPEIHVWELHDMADVESWKAEPLIWKVDKLIPAGGIGYKSGAPKDGKTLLTLDCVLHIAHGRPWLERFPCAASRVLYIAREDPARRLKERLTEINTSYGYGPIPRDRVLFLVRERFLLTEERHIDWLFEQTRSRAFDFVVLDVLNRMIPDLDEMNARDMGKMVSIIERLNRELNLTIEMLDHTRKPFNGKGSGRDEQTPNPFDLKGSVAKYGAADFMLCLSRTKEPGRLQLYAENKDTDERPNFFIDVSRKDSGKPKFRYAGDVEKFADDMKAKGDANREKVLQALTPRWESSGDIAQRLGMSTETARKHLTVLLSEKRVERDGATKTTVWRAFAETNKSLFVETD